MEATLKAIDGFAAMMEGKGYTGAFLTNAGHPGKLRESISDYLEHQTDDSLKSGFGLSTYLLWNGEGQENVQAYLRVALLHREIMIQSMEISLNDGYGRAINKVELKDLRPAAIPHAKDAIAMAKGLKSQNKRKQRRMKF